MPERGRLAEDRSDGTDDVKSSLHSYLNKQNKRQLVALIESITESNSAARELLDDHFRLSAGETDRIVRSLRHEITAISSKPGWTNHWNNEGYIPDYSKVKHRLETLLSKGLADEVVDLGKSLFEAGTGQVEMSDDEGETAAQIASCMDIVFQALPQSSLSPLQQMLWAVNCELSDEYDLCGGSDIFWDRKHKAAEWSALADKLQERLKAFKPKGDEDSGNYRRDALTDWIILALDEAGRSEETIPLCQKEAALTGSYVRLVHRLLRVGRDEEAEQSIREGIGSLRGRWPGIAAQLRDILYEMRTKAKDWPVVAAIDADAFFARPDLQGFERLRQSAHRARVLPQVKEAAMRYLETGQLPEKGPSNATGKTASSWPLPDTGLRDKTIKGLNDFPVFGTLVDIAIAEKRTEDVLRWYDQSLKDRRGPWRDIREDKVAQAVSSDYPDRAVAIWKAFGEGFIRHTQPSAYAQAGIYLAKVRRTLDKTGRSSEWQSYLAALRAANHRKKRLMEVLDRLDDKPIIETGTSA